MVHLNSKAAIAAHMNEKGAHLRQPYDPTTYISAIPSPASSSSALAMPQPVPASPIPAVATLSDVSFDQLLRGVNE